MSYMLNMYFYAMLTGISCLCHSMHLQYMYVFA